MNAGAAAVGGVVVDLAHWYRHWHRHSGDSWLQAKLDLAISAVQQYNIGGSRKCCICRVESYRTIGESSLCSSNGGKDVKGHGTAQYACVPVTLLLP